MSFRQSEKKRMSKELEAKDNKVNAIFNNLVR